MTSSNDSLGEIIQYYESAMREMGGKDGGPTRSKKGQLVEKIAKQLVEIAWKQLGGKQTDLSFPKGKYKVPIRPEYVKKFPDSEIRKYLEGNQDKMFYRAKQDISVYAKGEFVLSIECKAYSENAMMKRILIDAQLLKTQFPNLSFALIQLESQLTGDYSDLQKKPMGSGPTHTLMSHFPNVQLEIITLLQGERKVNQEIHKKTFYKLLTQESLICAVNRLADILSKHK